MNNKTIGDFIACLRKEKGITQKELAEFLNVSDKTVSHWECGENSPDLSVIPILAEYFGVSCDELIKGERKKEKSASVPTAAPFSILQATENPLSQAFHRFKIQNIISACISLLSVIAGIGIKELLTYVTYDYSANVFSLCITLCGSLISLACTVIFNIMFKNKLTQANDAYSYRFKANRISFLNAYLCLLSFSLVLSLTARYGYIFIIAALAVMIIIEIFTQKGPLNPEASFENIKICKAYRIRRSFTLICVALIASAGFLNFFISETYHPSAQNIIFYSAEEFKAYMETPDEKPHNSYIIDGATMTVPFTEPPTTANPPATAIAPEQNDTTVQSPVVTLIPGWTPADKSIETVCNSKGEEIISFRRLNNEVYDYAYNEEQGTFHVITYEAKIKAKNRRLFVDDLFPVIFTLFCIADVTVCYILCKRKIKKLTEQAL